MVGLIGSSVSIHIVANNNSVVSFRNPVVQLIQGGTGMASHGKNIAANENMLRVGSLLQTCYYCIPPMISIDHLAALPKGTVGTSSVSTRRIFHLKNNVASSLSSETNSAIYLLFCW